MKLTNNRWYLDYNATAPLSKKVIDFYAGGAFFYANPSARYQSARETRELVEECSDYLLKLFGLSKTHHVFFHSGTTEGANTLLRGLGEPKKKNKIIALETDHSCAAKNPNAKLIKVPKNLDFPLESIKKEINSSNENSIFNFTWSHNELGHHYPLDLANQIERECDCYVHVDATQVPGKLENWNQLDPEITCYSFSGHKFGALKGVGFSFIKNGVEVSPLLFGGGHQGGLRSGTENVDGIHSLKLALEELVSVTDIKTLDNARKWFVEQLNGFYGDVLDVIEPEKIGYRSHSTVFLVLKNIDSDLAVAAFDLKGIELTNSSACSSGGSVPNRVLLALGYSKDQARRTLRISFAPDFNLEQAQELWAPFSEVLSSLS